MNNLMNEQPQPEDSLPEMGKSSSPAVMLVTILLLISVLTLTGSMMLHYARPRQAPPERHAEETITLKDRASTLFREFRKPSETNACRPGPAAEKSSALTGLFTRHDGEMRWPKLKLTGLGTSADDGHGSFAIINGRAYTPGQTIDGKTMLIEVRAHEVVVRYQGEIKTLSADLPEH